MTRCLNFNPYYLSVNPLYLCVDKDVGDSQKEHPTFDIQSMALPMSNHKTLVKNSIAIVLDSLLEQEKGTAK